MATPICGRCGNAIKSSERSVLALEQRWHADCFHCHDCRKTFPDGVFLENNGRPYCSDCYNQFRNQCASCNDGIIGTHVEALGKFWHPEHFLCCVCSTPCATGFHKHVSGFPICKTCHQPSSTQRRRVETSPSPQVDAINQHVPGFSEAMTTLMGTIQARDVDSVTASVGSVLRGVKTLRQTMGDAVEDRHLGFQHIHEMASRMVETAKTIIAAESRIERYGGFENLGSLALQIAAAIRYTISIFQSRVAPTPRAGTDTAATPLPAGAQATSAAGDGSGSGAGAGGVSFDLSDEGANPPAESVATTDEMVEAENLSAFLREQMRLLNDVEDDFSAYLQNDDEDIVAGEAAVKLTAVLKRFQVIVQRVGPDLEEWRPAQGAAAALVAAAKSTPLDATDLRMEAITFFDAVRTSLRDATGEDPQDLVQKPLGLVTGLEEFGVGKFRAKQRSRQSGFGAEWKAGGSLSTRASGIMPNLRNELTLDSDDDEDSGGSDGGSGGTGGGGTGRKNKRRSTLQLIEEHDADPAASQRSSLAALQTSVLDAVDDDSVSLSDPGEAAAVAGASAVGDDDKIKGPAHPPWYSYFDLTHNRYYFYNVATCVTSWTAPEEFAGDSLDPPDLGAMTTATGATATATAATATASPSPAGGRESDEASTSSRTSNEPPQQPAPQAGTSRPAVVIPAADPAGARAARSARDRSKRETVSVLRIGDLDVPETGPSKASYLYHRAGTFRGWKKRFFRLEHNCLYYFKSDQSEVPLGRMPLPGCELNGASDRKKAHSFTITKPGYDPLALAAESDNAKRNWLVLLYPICQLSEEVLDPELRQPVENRTNTLKRQFSLRGSRASVGGGGSSLQAMLKKSRRKTVENADGETVLMYDGRDVMAGTAEKLVMRLFGERPPPEEYVSTLLLTYLAYLSTADLLTMMMERFNIVPPPGASAEQLAYVAEWKPVVQQRVVDFLLQLVERNWFEFHNSEALIPMLMTFKDLISDVGAGDVADGAVAVETLIMAKTDEFDNADELQDRKLVVSTFWGQRLTVLDFDPVLVARQVTLHDHKLLSAIRKEEFIVQMWGDAENEAQAKFTNNLTNMIDEFNYVSFWAATEICLLPDVNDRADMLKRFIVIAKECMRYNNYNSSMALVTGLNVAAVQRLKHTWSLIPSQLLKTLRELEKLMHPHGNFAAYRESNKDPPCIPFFGLYLKDLTFMDDGNPKRLENGLVNFAKSRQISETIDEICKFQEVAYPWKADPPLQKYIRGCLILDEKELYDYSKRCEPKNSMLVNGVVVEPAGSSSQ